MPELFGKIYPEIELAGLFSYKLRIVIDINGKQENVISLIKQLSILQNYLNDLKENPTKVEFFIVSKSLPDYLKDFSRNHVIVNSETERREQQLLKAAKNLDADLLALENTAGIDIRKIENKYNFLVVSYEKTLNQAEVFSRGHSIPWSFDNPVWNMPWQNFFSMCDSFGVKAIDEYQKRFSCFNFDNQTHEIVRSLLLNRVGNICFTRDKLLFLLQQKRFAKRRGWKRQEFAFETGYFLSHYYLILWGGLEQIARILNFSLDLKYKNRFSISLTNQKFINKVIEENKKLGNLYTTNGFLDWVEKLKITRNHIAHEGTIVLSPIVKEPEIDISDELIEKEAMSRPEYISIKKLFEPLLFESYYKMLKQNIKMSKYKVVISDAMVMQQKDKPNYYFPLNDIEWNFNHFKTILLKTFNLLYEYLNNKTK